MTDPSRYDAIVIGGGTGGLAAAAYLARAGRRTVLLEARNTVGGLCEIAEFGNGYSASVAAQSLYALDPRLIADLNLSRHGLRFVVRDASLAWAGRPGNCLVLSRDMRASMRSIAAHSKGDADAWQEYRSELFTLSRALRALWWRPHGKRPESALLECAMRTGSGPWLSSWFESDALKALLAFDAAELSPLEPGSALLFVWHAAQEMCGLQGAVAMASGGPAAFVAALARAGAKAGAEFRTNADVIDLIENEGRVSGVHLQSGDALRAPIVVSSLSRQATLLQLAKGSGMGLAERQYLQVHRPSTAAARVNLALEGFTAAHDALSALKGRLIFAERLESYVSAHAESRAGRIPGELTMEVTFPSFADPELARNGTHLASVLVRPLPRDIAGGWEGAKPLLAAKIVAALTRHFPGLAKLVVGADVLTPKDFLDRYRAEADSPCVARMLAPWSARVRSPIGGLFFCGADAEPDSSISGRAGRIAASFAMRTGAST